MGQFLSCSRTVNIIVNTHRQKPTSIYRNLNHKNEFIMSFDRKDKPTGFKRVLLASSNSFRALKWLAKNEAAFRQEFVMLSATVFVLLIWNISAYEKLAILTTTFLVLFAEIFNTAIEVTVDRISYEIHPLSKLAKDLGSAGVLISLSILVSVWLTVLYQNLI